MRAWWMLAGGIVVAIVGVGALDRVLPDGLVSGLYVAVIWAAGLGTFALRRHREKTNRTAAEGSIEREVAVQAAAWSFQVALVVIAGLGLYLLLTDQIGAGLLAFGLLAAVVAAHWIRYAIVRERLT